MDEDNNNQQDVAAIINSSATGVDSIAGLIGTITGTSTPTQQASPPPPPPPKKTNWLLIGGIGAGVLALILFLIYSKNGNNKQK